MNCPLYHDLVATGEASNPERWNPPSAIVGMCFQLHDSIHTLYSVAHVKNVEHRKAALLSALQPIEANLAFIKAQIAKL